MLPLELIDRVKKIEARTGESYSSVGDLEKDWNVYKVDRGRRLNEMYENVGVTCCDWRHSIPYLNCSLNTLSGFIESTKHTVAKDEAEEQTKNKILWEAERWYQIAEKMKEEAEQGKIGMDFLKKSLKKIKLD